MPGCVLGGEVTDGNVNVKGDGQECPSYTRTADYFQK